MWRAAVACVILLTACGDAESTPSAGDPFTSLVTVQPLQYRDDIVANRLQLQVTNGLDRQLRLSSVQLLWDGMNSELTPMDAVVGVGQRVDLPVGLDSATCDIDGTTVAAPPSLDEAMVVFTLTDDTTVVAGVVDDDGTLDALFDDACEREMIGQQVTLEFVDFALDDIDGRGVTVATLRLHREAADTTVQVLSSGNTIPFNLLVGGDNASPLLVLDEGATETTTDVQFLEARCDAHAVAEAKQPFRFVMQLQLGDDPARPYVVQPPAELHEQMLATAAAGCAALGEDGSLGG